MIPAEAYRVACPGCGAESHYLGSSGLVEDWDGFTYRFKCCGHRAHLDHENGGARTWVEKRSVEATA